MGKKFKNMMSMGLNYARASADIATLGAFSTVTNNKEKKAQEEALAAQETQKAEQAQAEKDKYQAMVDANFSDVAKKRSKMTGRPGSGLYAGLSGGSGGLYNV